MELKRFLCGMGVAIILAGSYGRSAKADPGVTADEPIPPTPALRQALGRGMLDEAVRQAQAPAAPGGPVTPGTTGPAAPPVSAPSPLSPSEPGAGALPSFASLSLRTPPEILGDQGPISVLQLGPTVPEVPPVPGAPSRRLATGAPPRGAALLPFIRQFKIAEMESPRPIDRVYFSFNFYDNLNASINRRLGSSVSNLRVYREFFGLEKTFWDQRASVGLRFPLNSLTADSRFPGLGGTHTAVGDLGVILKYAWWDDRETGDLISSGLLITAPTGPASFAGSPSTVRGLHDTTLQPFVGFIWNRGEFYLQGFSSVDVPIDTRDVTIYYNDLSAGYFVYHDRGPGRLFTGLAPTLEAHVTTPLNHRGFHLSDPVGTPDVVDLTYGLNVEVRGRSYLRTGIVTPVTGPRPFSLEVLVQYSLRF